MWPIRVLLARAVGEGLAKRPGEILIARTARASYRMLDERHPAAASASLAPVVGRREDEVGVLFRDPHVLRLCLQLTV